MGVDGLGWSGTAGRGDVVVNGKGKMRILDGQGRNQSEYISTKIIAYAPCQDRCGHDPPTALNVLHLPNPALGRR